MPENRYLTEHIIIQMLKRSTLQLLRFPFSFFLMPVFWFAVSSLQHIDIVRMIFVFCIIHLLVYPSSNGYNSYMDRDTDSIGGIKNPLPPEKELFYVTICMDLLAIVLSFFVTGLFALLLSIYIICSRLYSYRGIRLKKYPVIGYLIVVLNQGGLLFFMVYGVVAATRVESLPMAAIIAACFLIGGFYPITQIYQHTSDKADGVTTLSILLGKKGTFVFCAVMYLLAFTFLFSYYRGEGQLYLFYILQIFFLPVLLYFLQWAWKVWKDQSLADFSHTMQMNWLASACTNLGFITILIIKYFG